MGSTPGPRSPERKLRGNCLVADPGAGQPGLAAHGRRSRRCSSSALAPPECGGVPVGRLRKASVRRRTSAERRLRLKHRAGAQGGWSAIDWRGRTAERSGRHGKVARRSRWLVVARARVHRRRRWSVGEVRVGVPFDLCIVLCPL
ncbi:pollen-specific leucine-rich repeat extensin-like protein 3 [Iris pallida]|uniref:Pollen-specific leucine-rich repeat extensin-like protein 3 n=1 Tax=Iris pallida TaxID=29817 RepID=A0AAX6G1W2_IRIPA|nr:pollen-specific leucine-rich repeat extensin-like protein 3 [Iris pallida]